MRLGHQNSADTLVWDDFYPRQNTGEAQSSGPTMVHCQLLGMNTMSSSLHGFLLLCVGPWLCLRSVAPKGSRDGSTQYLFLGSPPSVPREVIHLLHKFCPMFQAVPKEWLHLIPLKAIRRLLHNAKRTFWLINVVKLYFHQSSLYHAQWGMDSPCMNGSILALNTGSLPLFSTGGSIWKAGVWTTYSRSAA